jgi:ion channel
MRWLAAIAGVGLLAVVLWDAFETIVLPRRVSRRLRLTRLFYGATWRPFAASARLVHAGNKRELYLSFYGPLSLLLLLALWAGALIVGFGLLQYAAGSVVQHATEASGLSTDLYLSGTTFFTLGLGDVVPGGPFARVLTVVEAGLGFGFLAIVIGYFPVLYQAFSRREVNISLLDARAGSPPTAAELLRRHGGPDGLAALQELLHEWERWAAELLETHLSYPLLAYFRSQHNNQSWLAALTTVLDTSALVMVGLEGACARQARLTFAMARHAVVDLAQVFSTPPRAAIEDRLPAPLAAQLRAALAAADLPAVRAGAIEAGLAQARQMYEPYVVALSRYLLQPLPPWYDPSTRRDNWERSAWDRTRPHWHERSPRRPTDPEP